MALAERVIPSNTATATERRIPFQLVDATDLLTPEDITVTGVKVSLSLSGGTPANSTNDIVKVSGTTGLYYLELTQTEANQTAGHEYWGTLAPSGCARTFLKATIGPAGVFGATVAVDAASVRTAVGLSTANLDSQLSTIDTVVDRIEVDTQDLQTQIGTDGNGLTALPWNAAWDAEVQSECTDALNAYDPPTRAELTTDTTTVTDAIAALDVVVDRVEVDTQDIQSRLPSALVGGRMNSNVAAVNNVQVDGTGTTIDPWGPAA